MRYLADINKSLDTVADKIGTMPANEQAAASIAATLLLIAQQLAIQNDLLAVRFGAAAARETERAS